eukprot:UN24127
MIHEGQICEHDGSQGENDENNCGDYSSFYSTVYNRKDSPTDSGPADIFWADCGAEDICDICDPDWIGDGTCDSMCRHCDHFSEGIGNLDGGDCPCLLKCHKHMIGDGFCDRGGFLQCETCPMFFDEYGTFDGDDCDDCAECDFTMFGDGSCDRQCENCPWFHDEYGNFDWGDCEEECPAGSFRFGAECWCNNNYQVIATEDAENCNNRCYLVPIDGEHCMFLSSKFQFLDTHESNPNYTWDPTNYHHFHYIENTEDNLLHGGVYGSDVWADCEGWE